MAERGELAYSNTFWANRIPPEDIPTTLELKVQLVFSLIVYLALPLHHLLIYIFESNVHVVKNRTSKFMAHRGPTGNSPLIFHPASLFHIALQESNKIIQEPSFQVRITTVTIAELRRLANPQNVLATIQEKAPFTYSFLRAFTVAPNEYRKRKAKSKQAEGENGAEVEVGGTQAGQGSQDGDDEEDDMGGIGMEWKEQFPVFARNPIFVSCILDKLLNCLVWKVDHQAEEREVTFIVLLLPVTPLKKLPSEKLACLLGN
ncbi:hypothetical protein C8T65DRAFT_748499 [Cerioporus squamosus]|nr:hypothetical protein C8T65DRAFT_748499 [Cerioporus squamosus]